MTHQQLRGKTIQHSFNEFHEKNPHVYQIIKQEAIKLIKKGAHKVSIKRVGNDIRFDKSFFTNEPTLFDPNGVQIRYKLNDAYLSRYNRLFANDHPEYKDKIEQRRLRTV